MTGTHFIAVEPWNKEKALLMMEASHCPCCKTKDILAVREVSCNVSRNHYYCRSCGTEWYGNTFDSVTYEMQQKKDTNSYINILLSCSLLCSVFLPFFVILLLII